MEQPTSSDKKRKASASSPNELTAAGDSRKKVDAKLDDPLHVLRRLAHLYQEPLEDPPCSAAARRNEIVKTKDRIQELVQLKGIIDKMHQKEDTKINALYDSLSPFLSLRAPLLAKILGYLDAEALYAAEQASFALASVILEHELWQTQYDDGAVEDAIECPFDVYRCYLKNTTGPKRRCDFEKIRDCLDGDDDLDNNRPRPEQADGEKIAIMRCVTHTTYLARNLEMLGEQCYDYTNEGSNSDIRERKALSLQPINGGYHSVIDAAQKYGFIRISRMPPPVDGQVDTTIGGPLVLALQMFSELSWHGGGDDDVDDDYAIHLPSFQMGIDLGIAGMGQEGCWPELDHLCLWMQHATETQLRSEYQQRIRSVFQGVRVSFVVDKKPLLTTGGCRRVELVAARRRKRGIKIWLYSRYDDKDPNNCTVVKTTLTLYTWPGKCRLLFDVVPRND